MTKLAEQVRVMIYVAALAGNDQRDAEEGLTYFKNYMKSLRSLSKEAHVLLLRDHPWFITAQVYVLFYKFDLVPENDREARCEQQ